VGEEFEQHRAHLTAVAYRMLGIRAEAEDAVQEAWLRYAAAPRDDIEDLRAWLTTVTARICLDVLRSARVRREAYVGNWLPEPEVRKLPSRDAGLGVDPGVRAARLDDISFALLTVLERLSPQQRVAFVLHDIFAVPFEEIAKVLGGTAAGARQLASRARRAVATNGQRHTADAAEQQRVLTAFLGAVERGDINGLLAVLAPDVVAIGDGGGVAPAGRAPVVGALKVARFIAGLLRPTRKHASAIIAEPIFVNGDLGLLIEYGDPPVRVVQAFAIADGRITGIYDQLNPAKLTRVPRPDPTSRLLG
jgi:RNA polymerase sigma-70 factor, ECF subfamily